MKFKYLFKSMLAMAGVFAATSCSQEELYIETDGDFVEASFTIETPEAILSRATIGDGSTVDEVCCAVFDAKGEEMDSLRKYIAIVDKKAQYNVRLAKGQAYRVAFFAYDKDTPAYDVTDMKNIQVLGDQACNVEGRDAFTDFVDVEATTAAIKETVTLRRPFAQLNLGAYKDDVAAAKNAGIEVAKSQVTVTNVYTAFSAYNDSVVGGTSTVTFGLDSIPTQDLEVDIDRNNNIADDEKFAYLALNYILVGNEGSEKSLVDVTFEWESKDGKTNAPGSTFNNIPVQRNYRTNIVGSLLTNPAEFNIEIDERFKGDKYESRVFNLNDLQAAIDNAPVGKTTVISLGANIEGNVTDIQKANRKVIIDGCGYKYNGTIKVHSNSNHYADAALTIKNVNFETSTASLNCIEALENGSARYSANITVESCSFTATGAAVNTAVGVQIKSSKNAKVIDCTATGMHSLIQAQSCDTDVIVENATIKGKNGVAFKQVKNAEVKGTTIEATGYGIRFDGNVDNYAINAENINVTAAQPFIVRKMTAQNNTIALSGENTLTVGTMSRADATAYQIVITNGSDDEAYVKPTGTYTLTGADDFFIFPERSVAKVGTTEYTRIDEAIAAWGDNTTLTLLGNVTLTDVIKISSTEYRILDLGTYTMTAAKGKNAIEIVNNGRASQSYTLDIKADANNPGGINAGSAVVKTTGKSGVKDRPIIRFYNGVFTANNIISHSGSNGTNSPQFAFYNGVYNGNISTNRAICIFEGGTFNGKFYMSVDSSSYARIGGGKFKDLKNWYGSTLNKDKITIGSAKGVFDRGVYVDDEGYFVVGGPVITEFGDKFAAKATNASKAGDYLVYSSAADNGLYYTNAEMAIAKHGEANIVLK